MMKALEITNYGDRRENGFYTHAFILGTFGTQLTVVGNPSHTAKAIIGQDDALPIHSLND